MILDMTWAHTQNEMEYVLRMRPIADDVVRNAVMYSHARDVDAQLLFDRCDRCYWYHDWAGWIDDTFFERRLRHCNKRK